MAIFKREGSRFWQYEFEHRGVRYRGSTEKTNKAEAAALDPDRRRRFDAIPTRLTLSAEQVDEAIEAGRRGLLATEGVRIFSEVRR
jgi:hypothetical protein